LSELHSGSEVYSKSEENSVKYSKFQRQSNADVTPNRSKASKDPLEWTRVFLEVDDVTRIPEDNYQAATLAAIKHRSEIIDSVDDDDEIEWTEDPFEN